MGTFFINRHIKILRLNFPLLCWASTKKYEKMMRCQAEMWALILHWSSDKTVPRILHFLCISWHFNWSRDFNFVQYRAVPSWSGTVSLHILTSELIRSCQSSSCSADVRVTVSLTCDLPNWQFLNLSFLRLVTQNTCYYWEEIFSILIYFGYYCWWQRL
jgi:hypothetical protein